jgi:hypothetical protein
LLRRLLVATLVFSYAGLAQAQPAPQAGWYGTIVSEFTTTRESSGSRSVGGGIYSPSGHSRAVRWTQVTYTLEDGQAKAVYVLRSFKESLSVVNGRMSCTLEDVAAQRARAIESSSRSSESETAQASGPGECNFETFAGGVHINCGSQAKGTSLLNISKSESCGNCCDAPPGGHTQKVTPASSSSTEIDLPSVDVESRFEGADIPESLVGSKYSESSDRTTSGTISWVLTRKSEYDVEVSPTGYDSWRPKGGKNEMDRGNALLFGAVLKRKDGKKLDVFARRFEFTLTRRSREPGVMMNWPPAAEVRSGEPDLKFDAGLNAQFDLTIGGEGGTKATTNEGKYDVAYAFVSSYDWGAHGVLAVEAILPSGRRVLGHLINDESQSEILIPKSSGPSDPIAEVWRREHNVVGIDAASDSDGSPVGDGHEGDGLTLYEEYRGFLINGQHHDTDPTKKDLFVFNRIGADAQSGLKMFGERTGLEVHWQLREIELSPEREINFNSSGTYQLHRQHGLIVEAGPLKDAGETEGGPSTPRAIKYVRINDKLSPQTAPEGGARHVNYYDATVMHEMGHACNIWHHGETDVGRRRWSAIKGVLYEGDVDDETSDTKRKKAIQFYDEDGTPIPLTSMHLPREHTVGVRQGQHSGNEECFMRYDTADMHRRVLDAARYFNRGGEVTGGSLCNSPEGSGVNDPSRVPTYRYGRASAGRGACAQQLCVNDGRAHPSR